MHGAWISKRLRTARFYFNLLIDRRHSLHISMRRSLFVRRLSSPLAPSSIIRLTVSAFHTAANIVYRFPVLEFFSPAICSVIIHVLMRRIPDSGLCLRGSGKVHCPVSFSVHQFLFLWFPVDTHLVNDDLYRQFWHCTKMSGGIVNKRVNQFLSSAVYKLQVISQKRLRAAAILKYGYAKVHSEAKCWSEN